jgi:hypothetical protein
MSGERNLRRLISGMRRGLTAAFASELAAAVAVLEDLARRSGVGQDHR